MFVSILSEKEKQRQHLGKNASHGGDAKGQSSHEGVLRGKADSSTTSITFGRRQAWPLLAVSTVTILNGRNSCSDPSMNSIDQTHYSNKPSIENANRLICIAFDKCTWPTEMTNRKICYCLRPKLISPDLRQLHYGLCRSYPHLLPKKICGTRACKGHKSL
jgi:hypothetical protein